MIYGYGNPSLGNRFQNSFSNQNMQQMNNVVNNHPMMTNVNAKGSKANNLVGCIICGKSVCGSQDTVKIKRR